MNTVPRTDETYPPGVQYYIDNVYKNIYNVYIT